MKYLLSNFFENSCNGLLEKQYLKKVAKDLFRFFMYEF